MLHLASWLQLGLGLQPLATKRRLAAAFWTLRIIMQSMIVLKRL
jgi:hypothetical protein